VNHARQFVVAIEEALNSRAELVWQRIGYVGGAKGGVENLDGFFHRPWSHSTGVYVCAVTNYAVVFIDGSSGKKQVGRDGV